MAVPNSTVHGRDTRFHLTKVFITILITRSLDRDMLRQMEATTSIIGGKPLVIYVVFLECAQWLGARSLDKHRMLVVNHTPDYGDKFKAG